MVGGEFDLETNFIIQDADSIGCMVELLEHCDITCQAEVWSMFTAILRKSVRNLQTSTEVDLIQQVLLRMSSVDDMIAGTIMVESLLKSADTTCIGDVHVLLFHFSQELSKHLYESFKKIYSTRYWQFCDVMLYGERHCHYVCKCK